MGAVSYRPPSRPPTGAWAIHLHSVRRERGLSQQQAFELVQPALGISPKSRAVYVALDMGRRQPNEDEARVLAAEFGWPPEGIEADAVATDQAAIVTALDRQTDAITALVDELRLARLRQETFDEQVLQLLAALAGARRDHEEQPSDSGRATPAGTAR